MTLTILSVSNPKYINAQNTAIDVTLTTQELGTIDFTATSNDSMAYGVQLFNDLITGKYGSIAPYIAPTLTAKQKAAAALGSNINITSTATSALNGTYAIDASTQMQLNAIITGILVNNTFPNSATTLPWPDTSGTMHTFSITDFKNFSTAILNYVAQVSVYGSSNGTIGSIPSNGITIA